MQEAAPSVVLIDNGKSSVEIDMTKLITELSSMNIEWSDINRILAAIRRYESANEQGKQNGEGGVGSTEIWWGVESEILSVIKETPDNFKSLGGDLSNPFRPLDELLERVSVRAQNFEKKEKKMEWRNIK